MLVGYSTVADYTSLSTSRLINTPLGTMDLELIFVNMREESPSLQHHLHKTLSLYLTKQIVRSYTYVDL